LVNSHDSKKPNIVCRKCSRKTGQEYRTRIRNETYDQLKEDLISSSDIVNTRIFDFDGDTLNIKNCKILSTNTIQKDQIMTNDDLISTFKVGNMGGIRYTKENDVIVLLSTHSDDYDDSIDTDSGLIIYTGEGKDDQELKNGNEKILNSQNTPMVFFKEVYQEQGVRKRGALDNKYKFVGVVKYQKHYWKTEKDRKVVKFVLEIQS
jgi:5-methylcytosine-specific restriction protein A